MIDVKQIAKNVTEISLNRNFTKALCGLVALIGTSVSSYAQNSINVGRVISGGNDVTEGFPGRVIINGVDATRSETSNQGYSKLIENKHNYNEIRREGETLNNLFPQRNSRSDREELQAPSKDKIQTLDQLKKKYQINLQGDLYSDVKESDCLGGSNQLSVLDKDGKLITSIILFSLGNKIKPSQKTFQDKAPQEPSDKTNLSYIPRLAKVDTYSILNNIVPYELRLLLVPVYDDGIFIGGISINSATGSLRTGRTVSPSLEAKETTSRIEQSQSRNNNNFDPDIIEDFNNFSIK